MPKHMQKKLLIAVVLVLGILVLTWQLSKTSQQPAPVTPTETKQLEKVMTDLDADGNALEENLDTTPLDEEIQNLQ